MQVRWGTPTLIAVALLCASRADAQDGDVAAESELHFQLGVEAYLKRRYTSALEHLLLSNRLAPNPSVAYNIGRTYENLGQLDSAYAYYTAAAEAWSEEPEKRAQVERSIAAIEGRLALVEVVSDPPGAAIYIDRTNLGQRGITPRVIAVSPGQHDVIVQLEGHEPLMIEGLQTGRGAHAALDLLLTPITAPVLVTGSPEGAEIRLGGPEGALLGTLPVELSLPIGRQDLHVSAPVHTPSYPQVTIVQDVVNRIVVDLDLLTGSVLVESTEDDALIEVDGQVAGFTPAVLQVPAGPHTVRVSAPGYIHHEEVVDVSQRTERTVSAALLPRQDVTAASRRAQFVSDAPASVSIVSAQEIRAFGYQSVWEAAGSVRGAYQTDDLTYQFLGLRGFSIAGDYGNRLLMTLDGHTYNDDLIGASYPAEGMMVDLQGVSQIEVVRGPGSALYGSNAFFGVVNVVTEGREEHPQGGVSMAAVRDGHARARVSAGVGDRAQGFWASAAGAYSQGLDYAFSELDEDGTGGLSVDNDALQAGTMMARAWAGDMELQAHVSVRDKQIPTASFETILDDDRAWSQDARAFIELRHAPRLGDSAQLVSRAYLDRYTFYGTFPYAREDGGLSEERWNGLWAGAEPRLIWEPGDAVRLTIGGEARMQLAGSFYGYENASQDLYLDEELLPRVFSGYTELDWVASPWMTLIAGGRLDHYSTFGLAASPRLAAVLKPSARDTIKLLAGRAFRAPSVYELTYNDNGTTQVTASSLDAETIVTAETEYSRSLGEVTSATVDVFYNQFAGLIDTYLNSDGLYQYANTSGAVRSAGTELAVQRDWRGGWMASLSYAYQRTRYGALLGEEQPTNSPAHRMVLKAASPPGPGGLRLASLMRAESARYTAADTWTDPSLNWDLTATGTVRGDLLWSLGARNVLDWAVEHPGGYDLLQESVPQRGRNLFAEVTYRR